MSSVAAGCGCSVAPQTGHGLPSSSPCASTNALPARSSRRRRPAFFFAVSAFSPAFWLAAFASVLARGFCLGFSFCSCVHLLLELGQRTDALLCLGKLLCAPLCRFACFAARLRLFPDRPRCLCGCFCLGERFCRLLFCGFGRFRALSSCLRKRFLVEQRGRLLGAFELSPIRFDVGLLLRIVADGGFRLLAPHEGLFERHRIATSSSAAFCRARPSSSSTPACAKMRFCSSRFFSFCATMLPARSLSFCSMRAYCSV